MSKKNKIDAAGSATNAGIDYQQRVGAWFLTSHYTGFNINKTVDIEKDLIIKSIHFETIDNVDDIRIDCEEATIYCQVKRKISSLSSSAQSDFIKAIKQFVVDFIENYSVDKNYVLITTSDSTLKAKKDLKKILTSIRLNDTEFQDNPLNKSEENTFKFFRTQFYHLYKGIAGVETNESNFIRFCKQVYISIIDLEEGSSNINAALMLLKSKGFPRPELIWKMLVANCLTYAAKRQSIDGSQINALLKQYSSDSNNDVSKKFDENFACGKDILLIKSFVENADFLIVELFRFDDVGNPKQNYRDSKLVIEREEETIEWNVVFRCSTITGMMRYLDENQNLYNDKVIAVLEAHPEIDEVEDLPHVIAFKEKNKPILSQNMTKWSCLHCDMSISSDEAYLVEIDEFGYKHSLGPIHKECRRNLDRVIGLTGLKEPLPNPKLKNFDFKKWVSLITKGQGQITAIKNMNYDGKRPVISYNFEREINEGAYCIRVTLEDKNYTYLYCGHEIERYSKEEGEYMLSHLNSELNSSKKDSIFATSINFNRGKYSELTKRKKTNEKLIKVVKYDLIKYSAMLSKINEITEFDYAPICLLYDFDTKSPINLDNFVPIITDPLRFDNLYENWQLAGFDFKECELKIIDNDKDFGLHLLRFFENGHNVVIDPEFDLEKNLVNGFPVVKHQDFIEQKREQAQTEEFQSIEEPSFFKGDKVKIVFPDMNQEKFPEGVLLEDEMENKEGERFVVFQPVENGEPLELMYSMPSKLIRKI
ncbi:MAG: hypothetical protein CVU05_15990 [Bacteroidetes bacterium HGW-Bacteroidetes-21]|jgi:hypothetical protein|nr:MAG: hypothetical protein CVU05_15990 [Bacteroidetes bacterium HGW-Bacteroidetes-21]